MPLAECYRSVLILRTEHLFLCLFASFFLIFLSFLLLSLLSCRSFKFSFSLFIFTLFLLSVTDYTFFVLGWFGLCRVTLRYVMVNTLHTGSVERFVFKRLHFLFLYIVDSRTAACLGRRQNQI